MSNPSDAFNPARHFSGGGYSLRKHLRSRLTVVGASNRFVLHAPQTDLRLFSELNDKCARFMAIRSVKHLIRTYLGLMDDRWTHLSSSRQCPNLNFKFPSTFVPQGTSENTDARVEFRGKVPGRGISFLLKFSWKPIWRANAI